MARPGVKGLSESKFRQNNGQVSLNTHGPPTSLGRAPNDDVE